MFVSLADFYGFPFRVPSVVRRRPTVISTTRELLRFRRCLPRVELSVFRCPVQVLSAPLLQGRLPAGIVLGLYRWSTGRALTTATCLVWQSLVHLVMPSTN